MTLTVFFGLAMIAAAGRLLYLAAERIKRERTRRHWQSLIASAHHARTASGRSFHTHRERAR